MKFETLSLKSLNLSEKLILYNITNTRSYYAINATAIKVLKNIYSQKFTPFIHSVSKTWGKVTFKVDGESLGVFVEFIATVSGEVVENHCQTNSMRFVESEADGAKNSSKKGGVKNFGIA